MFSQKTHLPMSGLNPAAGVMLVIREGAEEDSDGSGHPPAEPGTGACVTVSPHYPCTHHAAVVVPGGGEELLRTTEHDLRKDG